MKPGLHRLHITRDLDPELDAALTAMAKGDNSLYEAYVTQQSAGVDRLMKDLGYSEDEVIESKTHEGR